MSQHRGSELQWLESIVDRFWQVVCQCFQWLSTTLADFFCWLVELPSRLPRRRATEISEPVALPLTGVEETRNP